MALVLKDRVKETTTTTGTGTVNLAGATTGFETFVSAVGNSNTCYYTILDANGTGWEVGIGTVTDASPDTLSRTTILESSNSDNAITLSTGTHTVFLTYPADKSVYRNTKDQIVATASGIVFSDATVQTTAPVDTNTTYTAGSGLQLDSTTFNAKTASTSASGITILTNTIDSTQTKALTPKAVNDAAYLTAHPSISAASSSDNSGRTYIQDLLFDSNGHVTGIATAAETVTDTNTTYTAGSGIELSSTTFNSLTATTSASGITTLTNTINSSQTKALTPKAVNDAAYLTAHPNISAASSSDNSGRTYIQDLLFDSNGHVTGVATAAETVADTNTTYTAGSGLQLNSTTFDAKTASTSASGITILTNTIDSTQTKALTPKAVNDANYLSGTLNQDTTGSAATLTTARAIAVTGDVTGTANFDGSANISITTTLASGAVDLVHMSATGTESSSTFLRGDNFWTTPTASVDIDALSALGGAGLHQTQDHFIFSDNGTEKKITFSNLQDAVFADVSSDGTIAAGGALTIANDAIDSAHIADDAIDSEHYTSGSIDTSHIGNLQVTTGKIANDAIDGTKLADNAIDSEHYTDGSIDNAHLADDAVDSDELAAGAVDLAHMSSESVDEDNLYISNAGSNGEFLSKQSGNDGGLTWATPTDTNTTYTAGTGITLNSAEFDIDPTLISGRTEITSADADYLLVWDATDSQLKRVDAGEFRGGGGGGISFDGSTANGVLTYKDADEATVEANITFDGTDLTIGNDLVLDSDSCEIQFGDNQEITLTHVHNSGLTLKHTAGGDNKRLLLTLSTGETTLVADEVLSKLAFQAPSEASGGDAVEVAAAIQAVAEGAFNSTSNATRLEFMTGASEAATSKMTLSSAGNLGVSGALNVTGNSDLDGTLACDTSLTIDSTTISAAEIGVLDSVTAGTAAASKAVVLDGSTNIATIGTIGCGAITSTGSSSFATSVKTPLIEYTDGDDAITINDGGSITLAKSINQAANTATDGGAVDIDCGTSNYHEILMNANATSIVFTNATAGQRIVVRFKQHSSHIDLDSNDGWDSVTVNGGGGTLTWAGGTVPTLTETNNAIDVYGFIFTSTVTTVHGFIIGQDVK